MALCQMCASPDPRDSLRPCFRTDCEASPNYALGAGAPIGEDERDMARLIADLGRHASAIYSDMTQSELWSALIAARDALQKLHSPSTLTTPEQ